MDISPLGLLKTYLFQIPSIIKTSTLALIGQSPNASVQDPLTEIIVNAARPILNNPATLLKSQTQCKVDPGIWGPIWISRCTMTAPEYSFEKNDGVYDVRTALLKAIAYLGDGSEKFSVPEMVDVEAEWTGYRSGVSLLSPRPNLSEAEHYQHLMKEVSPNAPTILYFHGGAFCLMDPSTHRLTTALLAKNTHGRCLSIRYRLAPQSPFPSALLDGLIAYLTLLYPPSLQNESTFHSPIPSSQIVLAGDSSGANIATSLMLLLLTLPKLGITSLRFHSRIILLPIPLPAGLAITSPWLDISRSLPSSTRNARYDILAPPSPDRSKPHPNFPHDAIWPSSPPRVETYCEANMVNHPLVSPLAARTTMWTGAPPVYVSVGWEGMQDEAEVLARHIFEAGGKVVFDGYVGMPHAFSVIPWCETSRRALRNWAAFCSDAVALKGGGVQRSEICTWRDRFGGVREVKLSGLGMSDSVCGREEDLSDGVVEDLMKGQRDWRVKLEEELRREWKDGWKV